MEDEGGPEITGQKTELELPRRGKTARQPRHHRIYYLSFRRSRLDYLPEDDSLMNNSGFEYTFDLDRRTLHPIRHYFFVDKKWPFDTKKLAFALAIGFVWESKEKYSGVLATSKENNFQFILRPNIEF